MLLLIDRYIFLYSNTGNAILLTTLSGLDPYARVILVDDPRDSPVNSDANGYWFIESEDGVNTWGLYIKLDAEKYEFVLKD